MAQAKRVKVGQVWEDSKGRHLEVVSNQGADKKFHVRNTANNRTLKRGPRALLRMVKDADAGAGLSHHNNPSPDNPSQKRPKRRRRNPRQNPMCRLCWENEAAEGETLCHVCRAQFEQEEGPAEHDAWLAEQSRHAHFDRYDNPARYPSVMTRVVAEAMARMDPSLAESPQAIMDAAREALARFKRRDTRAPGISAYLNPPVPVWGSRGYGPIPGGGSPGWPYPGFLY